MSNIDSRTKPQMHDRFKTSLFLIRLLLKTAPVLCLDSRFRGNERMRQRERNPL
jgi:hypothetical protein